MTLEEGERKNSPTALRGLRAGAHVGELIGRGHRAGDSVARRRQGAVRQIGGRGVRGRGGREVLQMSRWTIFLKSMGCDMCYITIVFQLFSNGKSNFC